MSLVTLLLILRFYADHITVYSHVFKYNHFPSLCPLWLFLLLAINQDMNRITGLIITEFEGFANFFQREGMRDHF